MKTQTGKTEREKFEDDPLWQEAMGFADLIYEHTENFCKDERYSGRAA